MITIEHGKGVPDITLFTRAWDECSELQVQPKENWVADSIEYLESLTLYRLVIRDGGSVVGGLLLVEDDDVHVGRCLSVAYHYVLPEYRNKYLGFKLLKLALAIARNNNFKVLAYTHRVAPWTYITRYRKTYGKETQGRDGVLLGRSTTAAAG